MKIVYIIWAAIIVSLSFLTTKSNIVQEPVTVIEVTGDEVTVETEDGNLFVFYGNGYKVGHKYTAEFDTQFTRDRTDDKIIAVE